MRIVRDLLLRFVHPFRFFKGGQFGGYGGIIGQVLRIRDSKMRQEFRGRAVYVFSRVLWVARALCEAVREKRAQRAACVDAPYIINLRACGRSAIQENREG